MTAKTPAETPSTQALIATEPAAAPAPARRGPVELLPHQLAQVAGGSPKGGWACLPEEETCSPKGGWA